MFPRPGEIEPKCTGLNERGEIKRRSRFFTQREGGKYSYNIYRVLWQVLR